MFLFVITALKTGLMGTEKDGRKENLVSDERNSSCEIVKNSYSKCGNL